MEMDFAEDAAIADASVADAALGACAIPGVASDTLDIKTEDSDVESSVRFADARVGQLRTTIAWLLACEAVVRRSR